MVFLCCCLFCLLVVFHPLMEFGVNKSYNNTHFIFRISFILCGPKLFQKIMIRTNASLHIHHFHIVLAFLAKQCFFLKIFFYIFFFFFKFDTPIFWRLNHYLGDHDLNKLESTLLKDASTQVAASLATWIKTRRFFKIFLFSKNR